MQNNVLNNKLEEIIKNRFTLTDKNVFHYTNQKGYDGICRSKFIKLNSHHYLNNNDPANRELAAAVNLITNEINQHRILSQGNLLLTFNDFIRRGIVFYTASFSLHQSVTCEKKYGEYCLEFEIDPLEKMATDNQALFANVIYNQTTQREIIREMFDAFDTHNQNMPFQVFLDNLMLLLVKLLVLIPLFKEEHHADDNETRIVQLEGFSPDNGTLQTELASKKIELDFSHIKIYRY